MEVKVVAFSDTHGHHRHVKLPDCDIAIFAGDFTTFGYKHEVESFLNWYSHQTQCTERIWIAGNHDRCLDPKYRKEYLKNEIDWVERYKDWPGLIYLENSSVERFGLKIWGSPYTPWFHGEKWAFNAHRGDDIRAIWRQIPIDTDVVVTHGPVAYKRDYTIQDKEYVGCNDLRYYMESIEPKLHICGHIHEGYGIDDWGSTIYANASFCDPYNNPTNEPLLITLEV